LSVNFPGNFWAAKCSYVATLKGVEELNRSNRLEAEFWITSGAFRAREFRSCWDVRDGECVPHLYNCETPKEAYRAVHSCGR
jgi:hypothetical protein